jgi:uncharacterized protein YgbK (DUF1537 family)
LCPTPVAETEFAGDSVFGYTHSYLPDDGEEKTQGRIVAGDVDASCWPTCAVSVETMSIASSRLRLSGLEIRAAA